MTCWPCLERTNSTNCCASACTAGEALASIPIAIGSRVTWFRNLTWSDESPSLAPMPAELCTSASLIWPEVSACRVGPLVGLMTSPLLLSELKNFSPWLTPAHVVHDPGGRDHRLVAALSRVNDQGRLRGRG